jgi:GDPmannose 4,6-dehydratase
MEHLKGRKALVIGALGQDGQIISSKLIEKGVSVIGVAKNNDTQRRRITGVDYKFIDLSKSDSSFEFLSTIKPDYIFHFGAKNANSKDMASIENEEAESIIESTIKLSTNLFDWQLRNRNTKILVGLSAFMYSDSPKNSKIGLHSDYSPKGIYGKCNVATHRKILEYRAYHGSEICGLILFNHTSRYSKKGYLVPDLVAKISRLRRRELKSITINESNKQIDISSDQIFCDGFIKVIERGLTSDFIFSSGKLITIRKIVEDAVAVIDAALLGQINFIDEMHITKPIYGDISLTSKILDWLPDVSIQETLLDMLE